MWASDMRQYAIKRPSDEDDTTTKTPNVPVSSDKGDDITSPGTTSTLAANVKTPTSLNGPTPPQDVSAPEANKTETDTALSREKAVPANASVKNSVEVAADEPAEEPTPASDEPLAQEERLTRSAENLEKISAALLAYLENKNVVPPAASYDSAGTPLLSWRVLILPYLGHKALYDQFKVTEPWYTPHNKRLIDQMPAVFQSPERRDTKTNYLAVVGGSAAFDPSRRNGVHPRRFDDGIENTVLVVEVDDDRATTWTQPDEYDYDPVIPTAHLGTLRNGYFLVVWGNGLVGLVTATAPREQLAAMYSRDGGEIFSFSMVNRPLEMAIQQVAATSTTVAAGRPTSPNSSDGSATGKTSNTVVDHQVASVYVPASSRSNLLGIAGEYCTSAAAAYQAGDIPDALRWWYAGVITSPATSMEHNRFLWVGGLKRPRPTVQFAVGVEYSGRARQKQPSVSKQATNRRPSSETWNTANRAARDEVLKLTEPFGEKLLEGLEEHAEAAALSWMASAGPPTTGTQPPSSRQSAYHVVYLGEGTDQDLMRDAADDACDVLVLFDVKDSSLGTSRTVSFRVIDLERQDNLAASPQIVWRANSEKDPVDDVEEFRQSFWRIRDTLRDQLVLAEWPSQIQPRHAQARVAQLAEAQSLIPLVRLAEMTVYRNRGLIDDEQLFAGYRAMLDEADAIGLLLGSDEKKRRVLRQWLPTIAPGPPAAAGQRTGSTRDSDG